MPKGIPLAGKRAPRGSRKAMIEKVAGIQVQLPQETPLVNETDEQILARIKERFDVLDSCTEMVKDGGVTSMIVTGPAGVGKSYGTEKQLSEWDPDGEMYRISKGYMRPTGLFKLLYEFRHPGNVLVFDDCDQIFSDEVGLGILKAVCDSSERRTVSWLTQTIMVDGNGEVIPSTFLYEGTVVFITNHNLEQLAEKNSKQAPHYKALMSRALYVDLNMWSIRERMIWLRHSVDDVGLLDHLKKNEAEEVMAFIEENQENLREVSLRAAVNISKIRVQNPKNWEKMALITQCRNARRAQ